MTLRLGNERFVKKFTSAVNNGLFVFCNDERVVHYQWSNDIFTQGELQLKVWSENRSVPITLLQPTNVITEEVDGSYHIKDIINHKSYNDELKTWITTPFTIGHYTIRFEKG